MIFTRSVIGLYKSRASHRQRYWVRSALYLDKGTSAYSYAGPNRWWFHFFIAASLFSTSRLESKNLDTGQPGPLNNDRQWRRGVRPGTQNRRQKVVNRGALRSCRRGLTFKFDKNSTNFYCFIFQFGGSWSFLGDLSPPKHPRGDGTAGNPILCCASEQYHFKMHVTKPEQHASCQYDEDSTSSVENTKERRDTETSKTPHELTLTARVEPGEALRRRKS